MGDEEKLIDRRNSERINVDFPAALRSLDAGCRSNTSRELKGSVINLSERGTCVSITERLSSFEETPLEFNLLLDGGLEIGLKGKLVWKKAAPNADRFLYGFAFMEDRDFATARKLLCGERDFILKLLTNGKSDNFLTGIDQRAAEVIKTFSVTELKTHIEYLLSLERELVCADIPREELFIGLEQASNDIVSKADQLQYEVDNKLLMRSFKDRFRDLVGNWVFESLIMHRAFRKPRGYPGDYRTLEWIYDNQPFSRGIGFYFDRYFLNNPYAIAVRNRKDKMRDILQWLVWNDARDATRVLNLACGSCRELEELLRSGVVRSGVVRKEVAFTCIDQDREALDFAKGKLASYSQHNVTFRFIEDNILNLFKSPDHYRKLLGTYDVVYSIGLADYLPDRILSKVLQFGYHLLESGGKFIITHKDKDRYAPIPADWYCDWNFVKRNEDDLITLVKNACKDGSRIDIEREKTGCIFFLVLTKGAGSK